MIVDAMRASAWQAREFADVDADAEMRWLMPARCA